MNAFDRYLRIVTWARKRYTQPDGYVVIAVGNVRAPFRRIDDAAAVKYLHCNPFKLTNSGRLI